MGVKPHTSRTDSIITQRRNIEPFCFIHVRSLNRVEELLPDEGALDLVFGTRGGGYTACRKRVSVFGLGLV